MVDKGSASTGYIAVKNGSSVKYAPYNKYNYDKYTNGGWSPIGVVVNQDYMLAVPTTD